MENNNLTKLLAKRSRELIHNYNRKFNIENIEMSDYIKDNLLKNEDFSKDIMAALFRFLYEECFLDNYLETKSFRVFNYRTSKGTVAFIVNGENILLTLIIDKIS